MLPDNSQFELLFGGVETSNAQIRLALSLLLENTCGLQLIELETTLGNAGQAISILSARTPLDLESTRDNLVKAGAKVLIVRSGDFKGPKIPGSKA